jgi:TonB family protein
MEAAGQLQNWPRFKWSAVIVLILTFQVAMIFWLQGRTTPPPPPVSAQPVIYLPANREAELPGVDNPTFFVLPNQRGFSGPAWMKISALEYHPAEWTEPPRPLALPVEGLGRTLGEFVRSEVFRPFDVDNGRARHMEAPFPVSPADLVETQSTASVEGDLAGRPLLSSLNPVSQPAAEILSNSVVQIAVDAEGRVFSPALLRGSGSLAADADALALAKSVRFQPLPSGAPDISASVLTWGKVVFHWHTVPSTNTVSTTTPQD